MSSNGKRNRTNVIYLTTLCNLDCTYCYERESRHIEGFSHKDCTTKDIDLFLQDICDRESGEQSSIVLMGGEPFLRFDLIEYSVSRCLEIEKPGGFAIDLITNGTLLASSYILERLANLLSRTDPSKVLIDFEISYDVSGHGKRCFLGGASSERYVLDGIQAVIDYEIPFGICYTCHSGNCDLLKNDIVYILERWMKTGYLQSIAVGFAFADLGYEFANKLRKEFKPFAEILFNRYGIPICGVNCGYCKRCRSEKFIGNAYLSPVVGINYEDKETFKDFKQFTREL